MKTKCEVYSRIVGYLRPITQWNEGKVEEFKDRKHFRIPNQENVGGKKEEIKNKIKLFKKPTCEKCKNLYEKLKAENIDFDEVWFKDSIEELKELGKKQGLKEIETPIVLFNDKIYTEVTYEKVLQLINK